MDARDRRASPRAHWALLGVLTILMMLFLLLSGLVNGQAGESAQNPSSRALPGQVPEALHGGGPIVDPSDPEAAGRRVADGHVVLTFDDGPSKWTEEILDVLAARKVKATFFLVGARGGPPGSGEADVCRGSRGRSPHIYPRQPGQRLATPAST
jgi:hypothetical protein